MQNSKKIRNQKVSLFTRGGGVILGYDYRTNYASQVAKNK